MKEKTKKLLFEYVSNPRQTTKEIGKKIGSSQQSVFYLINALKEKEHILGETTIVDAQKLGYTNTLAGFNYTKLDEKTKTRVINHLKKIPEVILIEESKEGFDLLVEFSTKNLAALDNLHSEIINSLDSLINTVFIFPIITKYLSLRKYLRMPKVAKTKILFGDRDFVNLNEHEKQVLRELVKNPTIKIIDIAEKIKISTKSVTKIKKNLENRFIIKGYSAILNNKELGINRQIVFLRFPSIGLKEIQDFLNYAKQHENIIEAMKIIGSSHAAIVIESVGEVDLIREIRSKFLIQNYMIFRSEKIHKKKYLPIED